MYVSKREAALYAGLAVFTFAWTGAFSLLGMDLHHDGVMFKAASDAAAGKWVFRETFCQYGLLSPLLQGAFLKLFGTELAALKLATAAFYAPVVILCDLLWRRFLSPLFRAVNLVMFFVLAPYLTVPFHIWSSVYALFFMLLGAELFLLADEKGKGVFLYFSGLCAMLAFGFRQPCGVVMLTAQIIALGIARRCRNNGPPFRNALFPIKVGGSGGKGRTFFHVKKSFPFPPGPPSFSKKAGCFEQRSARPPSACDGSGSLPVCTLRAGLSPTRAGNRAFRKQLAILLAGAGTAALLFAAYITAAGAWRDYLRQTFSFVGGFAFERGGGGRLYPLIEAFLPHSETMNFIFSFVPLTALGLFFFTCRKFFSSPRSMQKDLPLISLLLFGLASYHQYYPVPCVRHLYWGAVPMFGAFALLMQRIAFSGLDCRKKVLFLSLLALPLLWGGALRMYGGLFRLSEFFVRTTTDVPGLRYIRHGQGEQFICRVAADIRRNLPDHLKKRGVFNYTGDGVWSVILPEAKGFAHPMFVNWKKEVYPDYPEKALAFIDRVRPAVMASTPFYHPAYVKAFEFRYMGTDYSFWLPVEGN
ncbi:MAG: hypothetical protein IJU70_09785 [Lentisphaeria bacterium]|nr:hypothetical protein [Lentisphaeria bacterium]